jgi:CelD/BcsL family acetyltransferase involved in cellulose biosynthesis
MLAPLETAITTEWRPLAGLAGIAAEWRALARRAVEPNIFYEPAFALAAAPVLGPDAGAVLVRSLEPRRLIGLFPCRVERRRYGIRLPLLAGWTHPYAPLGTPLVDRDAIHLAVSAFLDHVADDDALPKLLLMSCLVEDGAVAAALDDALAQRGGRGIDVGRHQRALLAPAGERAGYVETVLGDKRLKKLDRQRRRLAKDGTVAFVLATSPADVSAALADFFALEASGWKGAAGTAAAQTPAIRQFMETAVAGLAAQRQASLACLVHAGRVIAADIVLRAAEGAWIWKVAYDEAFAPASPGVLLALDATRTLLADPTLAWCDSCAGPDHPMIDRLWGERRTIVDRLIALAPSLGFAAARRIEPMRRRIIATARRARDLVRRG